MSLQPNNPFPSKASFSSLYPHLHNHVSSSPSGIAYCYPTTFPICFFYCFSSISSSIRPEMESQEPAVSAPLIAFNYSNRVTLKTIVERSDRGLGLFGQRVVIGGWVRSSKVEKKEPLAPPPVDVSCVESLQSRIPFFRTIIKFLAGSASQSAVREKLVVVHSAIAPVSVSELLPTGTCILAEGVLQKLPAEGVQQKPPAKEKHVIELTVEKILHVGTVQLQQNKYPLSEKRLPLDSFCSHFRPRTTTVASITRIRCALTLATHTFFQSHGFLHVEAPIITITDCEGFSDKFQVTTLLRRTINEEPNAVNETQGISPETVKVVIKEKTNLVEQEALANAVKDLRKTNELAQQLEAREESKPGTAVKGYGVNFNEDFFSRQTYLTVSGHLHLESYACSVGHVYSFGPRFRADKKSSSKNVAETWIVEIEMAFSQLEDAIRCADDYFRFLCKCILDKCSTDLDFLTKRTNKTIINHLKSLMENSSEKITYTEVVDRLRKVTDKEFKTELQLGVALTAEHLSIKEFKLPRDQCGWYLDLRRHGTVKHSVFSIAFDLMVLLTTGLTDVRDTIPFLRSDDNDIN